MKNILWMLLGAFIAFIAFLIYKKKFLQKSSDSSATASNLLAVAKTNEAKALIKSKEFKNLIQTEAFIKFMKDFGTAELSKYLFS